ncbi:hypothetical protein E4U59_004370 [Claviceps monticola]|nr:hypothetical protein E4U59_004370 [Claviceps monticola]
MVSERSEPPPQEYTYGWQRATLLGAFFNAVFLLALGVSILVQAIERFADIPQHDHDHGHVHFHSNTQSHGAGEHMFRLADAGQGDIEVGRKFVKNRHYGHKHVSVTPARPGKDLGLFGVFVHVVGDAINNVGVIIAALIIWRTDSQSRYYADPAVGVFIAIMIFLTALPLTKSSGSILLQIAPDGIDLGDVKHDIETIDGVHSVHELHIWRLNQQKSVATAHIVVDENIARNFTETFEILRLIRLLAN